MGKLRTTINLSKEANETIQELRKNGFNLSDWVENQIYHSFGLKHKKAELKGCLDRIEELKHEIAQIQERQETYKLTLGRDEIRFIQDIPRRLNKGMEWNPMLRLFNNTYQRELTLNEFKERVKYYAEKKERK